jgi:hypothetical protein
MDSWDRLVQQATATFTDFSKNPNVVATEHIALGVLGTGAVVAAGVPATAVGGLLWTVGMFAAFANLEIGISEFASQRTLSDDAVEKMTDPVSNFLKQADPTNTADTVWKLFEMYEAGKTLLEPKAGIIEKTDGLETLKDLGSTRPADGSPGSGGVNSSDGHLIGVPQGSASGDPNSSPGQGGGGSSSSEPGGGGGN